MRNKKIIFTLLIFLVLTTSMACLSFGTRAIQEEDIEDIIEDIAEEVGEYTSDETEEVISPDEATEETISGDTGTFQELILLDKQVLIQDENDVFVAYFFENPNSNIIFEDLEFTVYLYDAGGNEISSTFDYVHWFFPNQTLGIVFNFYLSDEDPAVDSVSIEWEYDDAIEPDGFTYPFSVEDTIFWPDDYYPVVTGRIINSDSNTYTDIKVYILCYNSAGEIVGGGYSYLDFIPGQDYMGFTDYVDVYDQVASIEVYPIFTYSTVTYEGDDFWSDVSLLDDYFYESQYGTIYGGAVIQNNAGYAIRNTTIYATFYDDADHVTTTGAMTIDLLLPGDSIGVAPWINSQPDDAVTTSYDILVLPGEYVTDYELTNNPFTVNSANVTGDYNDYVAVNLTNTYSKSVSEIEIFVLLYNADGQIIGGGYDWTEAIPAGGSMDIEIWVSYDSDEEIDSVEVWIEPNYWTVFE